MTSTDVEIEVKNIDSLMEEYIEKGLITAEKANRKTLWNTNKLGLFDLNKKQHNIS